MARRRWIRLVAAVAVSAFVTVAAGSAGAAQSLPSLGGWWRFDENTGTSVSDSSGNGNTGTVSSSTAWTGGKFGSGLDFASGAYVQVPRATTLESQTITAEAWVKYSGNPGPYKYILAKGANAAWAASYGLYTGNGGGIGFYVADCSAFAVAYSGSGPWDGSWHRVTGTYGGGYVRVYVDGVEVANVASTLTIEYDLTACGGGNTNDLSSGTYLINSPQYGFPGTIDEPRVWTRALSSGEVADTTAPAVGTVSVGPILVGEAGAALSATATDPYGVVGGEYSLDGGPWTPMTLTDSTLSATIDTSALPVGVYPVAVRATDYADNTSAPATANLQVEYGFEGFFSPVDNPPTLNVAKAGSSVPLKFRVFDANGAPVTDLAGVMVKATSLACSQGVTADQIEEYAAGASGLQNLGDGYYQFNWKTPKTYANSCKTVSVDLNGGGSHTALFSFTK